MRFKMLTEKQATAIWNMVIIPKLEYQLQGCLLTENECKNLMSPIMKLCKHKGYLPSSLPNYIMFDKDLMGVKNIYDLQLEFLSKNLLYFANHKGLLGQLFNIHLKNIQHRYWTSSCIGDQSDYINMGRNHYIADALKLLKNANLTICDHKLINNNHHVKKGEASGRKILKWTHLCKKLNMSTKGVQPQWYKELIKVVTVNDGSRNLRNRYFNMNKDWSYKNNLSIYDEEGKIDKNELLTWNENNEVIIGKYRKKSSSKKFKKLGTHWIICNNNMLEDSPELVKYDKEHMINNNIDLVDRYIEADINDTLLIKEFIEKFSMHKDLSVNLKVDIMKESFEWENKKKLPSSYRLKLDIFSPDVLDDKLKNLRCEKEPETWEHIWICENNDMTEYDVFIKSMIEIEEEYKNGDNKDLAKFKALRILNAGLALFMQDKSKVLILDSQIKVREITRGLFNNKLYDLTRNKIERQVVDEIWERSFLNIRKWLWLNRCNEVEVIEKTKGVSKTLKKRKRDPPIVVKSSSDAGNVIDLDNDIKNKKVKKMLK
ncbi:hypothetical protein RhiirC2_715180 [Rhizophagus irregularis]|uniref:Uncharacterized protein n=1 Tax=Rhizophagus irregularis TaxID=588596 RepID=A0A2N1MWK7_9GLOM|nr:hypothetical protein RhiirC2_715180 [Rhizophagus irregularis]